MELVREKHQQFVLGSGSNFDATNNILIEIIYSVNDVQFFYTRSFIHYIAWESPIAEKLGFLEKFKSGERDGYGFGDMFPETYISLSREKHADPFGEEGKTCTTCKLEISADIGAVIGGSGPGERRIDIKLVNVEAEAAVEFMRQLTNEIADVYEQKHPDPAKLAEASSEWNFARLVNRKAYDLISQDYREDYFSEPLLTETFDAWIAGIPSGGHILDLGCGHGQPIIARLLEKGYRVTGADLSPKMLERARQNFPKVSFVNQLASDMTCEAEFNAACSLSSLLYLDPIDLSYSLYRLHHALKPGGTLFLYAYDLHPGWRGHPYHVAIQQWMWAWTYSIEEAALALEEHGTFEVLRAQEVTSETEKQERVEKWYKYAKERYEVDAKQYPGIEHPAPDRNKPPLLSYKYIIVAQALPK